MNRLAARTIALVGAIAGLLALQALPAHAAFPGENGKIAFTCGGEFGGICTINPDGSDLRSLPVRSQSEAEIADPAWSPDGTRILYRQGDDRSLWLIAADGTNRTPLPLSGVWASWSPDGSKLVFGALDTLGVRLGLFTAALDGGDKSTVTSGQRDRTPAWSPTGSKIAFVRDASGSFRDVNIYTVRPDGTEQTKITQLPYVHEGIDWSPDGSRLVFATSDGNSIACEVQPPPVGCEHAIWVVNQDGSGLRKLVDGDENALPFTPAFSPDGTRIVFAIVYQDPETGRPIGDKLYTMNPDGSEVREIFGSGEFAGNRAVFPDWQPLPFKNASAKCKAFPGQYRNHGQCVKANR